jgi:hypothetical protein
MIPMIETCFRTTTDGQGGNRPRCRSSDGAMEFHKSGKTGVMSYNHHGTGWFLSFMLPVLDAALQS